MNDDFDSELNELVSAYLDGEADDDEIARVEASPELRDRANRLRFVAAQVAAPVAPPPADQRDTAIVAALAASATAANVTALATRHRRSARTVRIASVAAVVAFVMLAVPLLLLADRGADDSGTEIASEAAADPADDTLGESDTAALDAAAVPQSADEPAEEPAEPAAAAPAPQESLAQEESADAEETFADDTAGDEAADEFRFADQLRAILVAPRVVVDNPIAADEIAVVLFAAVDEAAEAETDGSDSAEDGATAPDAEVPECIPERLARLDSIVLAYAITELDDRGVVALVLESPSGERVVLVLDSATCAELDEIAE